jgi:glycosyltransferase involved in cell wall biosynthesis
MTHNQDASVRRCVDDARARVFSDIHRTMYTHSSALRPTRVAVVGISDGLEGMRDGVRDHARLLALELGRENVSCELLWLRRGETSLRGSQAEIRAWTQQLALVLAQQRPDAILLHYSVFFYSYRGLPLFVRPVLSALQSADVPMVTFLHEFVFPWRREGWRGSVWAITQRALLRQVIDASASVVVTTDSRAGWLLSRRWLARRQVLVAPVFSNLPPPETLPAVAGDAAVIGLFGYAHPGASVSLVIDALADLRRRGLAVKLRLLGAPGSCSGAGEAWSTAAHARDLGDFLSFSGALPAQALSDALAGCDVLLVADPSGPSSRRGTLAASLASGVPVVAIDGPDRWTQVARDEAVRMVAPTSQALAGAVASLLADASASRTLGARGRAFAEREMTAARCAHVVRTILDSLASKRV